MKPYMKPIFIKKAVIVRLSFFLGVLLVLYFGFLFSQKIILPVWLENTATNKIVNEANPKNKSVSFMVLVEDQASSQTYLPKLLQLFAKHGVKATFFVSGAWAENNRDFLQGILARNHELGNYAYENIKPSDLNKEENIASINKTKAIIKKNSGATTNLFTPPFGIVEDDVFQAAVATEHKFVLASIDSNDWQAESPEQIISQVLSKTHDGSLISIHLNNLTLEALPTILEELASKGLGFLTVSDNLK